MTELIDKIKKAFSDVKYPGDWCLKNSTEGQEPYLLELEFKGKTDWQTLSPDFLDRAPDGYSSALSFFSDEAFRFYLPAYLVADIENKLKTVDVAFHLTHGLDNKTKNAPVNPKRYGARTWYDAKRYRFSVFNNEQVKVIEHYLKFKLISEDLVDFEEKSVRESLTNYWAKCSEGNSR